MLDCETRKEAEGFLTLYAHAQNDVINCQSHAFFKYYTVWEEDAYINVNLYFEVYTDCLLSVEVFTRPLIVF